MKERYEKNKEQIIEQSRQRYRENKEQILQKQKEFRDNLTDEQKLERNKKIFEKITCVCGCISTKHDLSKHMKTKKHNDIMKNINILI